MGPQFRVQQLASKCQKVGFPTKKMQTSKKTKTWHPVGQRRNLPQQLVIHLTQKYSTITNPTVVSLQSAQNYTFTTLMTWTVLPILVFRTNRIISLLTFDHSALKHRRSRPLKDMTRDAQLSLSWWAAAKRFQLYTRNMRVLFCTQFWTMSCLQLQME